MRVRALIWLRSRMWWHGLRSRSTAADTAVGFILTLLAALVSISLASVLSLITVVGLSDDSREPLRIALTIVCWMVGFLAVVVPVVFGLGQTSLPLRRLLVFPISRGGLYRISLAASFASGVHIFWYPVLGAIVIAAVTLADAPVLPWFTVAAVFALCMVIWCHAVQQLVQRMLQKRRVRELAALLGLVVVVIASMLPAMYQERAEQLGKEWFGELVPRPVTFIAGRAASVFPPSLAARAFESFVDGDPGPGVGSLGWLVLWAGVGLVVGGSVVRLTLLEGDVTGGPRSAAKPSNEHRQRPRGFDRLTVLPPEVQVVASKELRYLLRSTVGKFNLVIMPVFVIIMTLIVARDLEHSFLGLDRTSLVFVGLMIYASMFSNNFLFNAYAWEAAGVQSYFLSPVEPARIVLGKNVGVWFYNAILGLEAIAAFCLISGPLPVTALAGGCLAFVAAVLLATIVGNFLSPAMPVPRDISSITNSPSQTAVLASFGVLIINALVIGGCIAVPSVLGFGWLGPLVLIVLIVIEIAVYSVILQAAGRFLASRRESLIEALQA